MTARVVYPVKSQKILKPQQRLFRPKEFFSKKDITIWGAVFLAQQALLFGFNIFSDSIA